MGVFHVKIYDMYPIMLFGHWSGGVCVVYAGTDAGKAYKAIHYHIWKRSQIAVYIPNPPFTSLI